MACRVSMFVMFIRCLIVVLYCFATLYYMVVRYVCSIVLSCVAFVGSTSIDIRFSIVAA